MRKSNCTDVLIRMINDHTYDMTIKHSSKNKRMQSELLHIDLLQT